MRLPPVCRAVALLLPGLALLVGAGTVGQKRPTPTPFQIGDVQLSDRAGHRFTWRETCGNSMPDHRLGGGFEWEADSRNFLAEGDGNIRGQRRPGLFMLSFPDGDLLNATWQVRFPRGHRWRLRYGLTDEAAAQTIDGLRLIVTATDAAGATHTLVDRVLKPRDTTVYDEQVTFDYEVRRITFTHDNLGRECWDVLWLEPGGMALPRPPAADDPIGPAHLDALRAAIDDLADTFGARYPNAARYRARLAIIRTQAGRTQGEARTALIDQFAALQRAALVANPLVNGRPLIYVVRPQYRSHYHAIDTLFHTGEFNPDRGVAHSTLFDGGGAIKSIDLARGGAVRTLVATRDGMVRDPEVSFDGSRILYAYRRNAAEDYHIWEMQADGSAQRQLTRAAGVSDFDPIYMPDGSILFSSTRDPKFNQCSRDHGANLYRMGADGTNIHQVERNNLFQNQPSLLPDGRVLYARWEYVDRNFGDAHGIWAMNPDGTNQSIYWGNNASSPGAAYTPRVLPGGKGALCIFGPHHDHLWGALALVNPTLGINGTQSVQQIWPADSRRLIHIGQPFDCDSFSSITPKYADPYPLSDRYFLCSRMTGKGDQMGIYLLDLFGNEILLHTEGAGCYDAMPLRARSRPPVIPPRSDFAGADGTFYVADVYRGTHMAGVARGSVKRLRVVEVPAKRFWSPGAWFGQGYTAPGMNWHSLEAKRILGTVPVEADGSAYFRVPADTLVYFQLLDARGRMVQSMRSATMVHSGERAGCVGCHDERRSTPPAVKSRTLAMQRTASSLTPWYGPARNFSFMAEVQPVLDRNCVGCHDYGKPAGRSLNLAGDRDFVFNTAYVELWRKGYTSAVGAGPAQIQPARSWGSSVSRLVAAVQGDHHGLRLDPESLDRITTWVDLNAPYYSTYASAYPDNWTGRCPLDTRQMERLEALAGVAIRASGSFDRYAGPFASFTRPEMSPILAGLGGPGAARYEEALALIRSGAHTLAVRPNADMPGFEPNPTDRARQAFADRRWQIELANRAALSQGRREPDR